MEKIAIWEAALLFAGCGAVGGLVNALLAGDLHLPHREGNVYSPGWIGNVVIGAVAALVTWGLYGPLAKAGVVGYATVPAISELAGAILTGIGGGRILSNEVEKKALVKAKDELTETLRTAHG
jgi:hypothetical protein